MSSDVVAALQNALAEPGAEDKVSELRNQRRELQKQRAELFREERNEQKRQKRMMEKERSPAYTP